MYAQLAFSNASRDNALGSSPRQPESCNLAAQHGMINNILHNNNYSNGSNSNTKEQPQETFPTVEGQKFATQMIDNMLASSGRVRSNKQRAPPPSPKYSMLRRWRMSWCCEISSVRPASLRRPYGQPTLNFGGKGVVQRQGLTLDAQMRVLRTFVRQQSLIFGSSMDCPCAAQRLLNSVHG